MQRVCKLHNLLKAFLKTFYGDNNYDMDFFSPKLFLDQTQHITKQNEIIYMYLIKKQLHNYMLEVVHTKGSTYTSVYLHQFVIKQTYIVCCVRGGPFDIQGGALYFIGSQIFCLCSYESQIIFLG